MAEDKLTTILTVAAQCFAAHGYEATSLNEVADRVKIHKATLYHYIDSKESILYQCLLRSFADLDAVLQRLTDRTTPPLERLAYFFRNLIVAQNNVFGRCLNLVGPQPLGNEPGGRIRQFQQRLDHAVRALIEEGIADGTMRRCHPGLAAAMLFGAFNWVPRWHKPGRGVSLDQIADTFLDIFVDGVSAHRAQNCHGRGGVEGAIAAVAGKAGAPADDKLTTILTVAAQCFADHGYDATSLNDVADKVKIHKATLYHYIDSKESILYQCLLRSFADHDAVLQRLTDSDTPPLARLEYFFANLIVAQNNVFGRCLNLVGPQPLGKQPGGRIRQFQQRLDQAARALIEEGIAQGSMRACHPGLATAMLFGASNWVPRWYKPGGLLGLDQIAAAFLDLFVCGIAARD